ncbi:MAG: hypothetical protein MR009_02895 [Sutterellaceae bacterium]|nr:hypothetical protein [Sutterellaceae bacterium]MDD7441807.1 hypothetical protein [Sutterellaceae bacterium]MDY2868532.1 hypothetical protein [Mesosutterella sp.]
MSLQMLLPMLLVIAANTLYNVSAKGTPRGINPFASLTVTYLTAAVVAVVLFLLTSRGSGIATEFSRANWTAFALGAAVVGLEAGYIFSYRAGWPISTAQLVGGAGTTIVLVLLGYFFYHDVLSLRQVLGIVACGAGLALITL